MKVIATRSMHKAFDRFEERMMRAMMPATHKADPPVFERTSKASARTLTLKPLTYKLMEVR